ncbi:hypothetical protein FACS18942_04260 [Planctomycetales bacterium]|nr:hypothetical protein FACS18942_04260 [Planctomycetales bacterium]
MKHTFSSITACIAVSFLVPFFLFFGILFPLPVLLSAETSKKITADKTFEANSGFQPKAEIDRILLASLQKKNMKPAPLCSDAVFIRRIYLDLLGIIPPAAEVREFLQNTNRNKRSILIGKVLNRPEFVDYQTMRWCDILRVKSEFPINLWPNGAMCYYRWLHSAVENNMPYDAMVRSLILAEGSNFRDGASNFYRAVSDKNAETIAETAAQTFLGLRPDVWSPEQHKNFAVFFSRIGFKETAQWKEEIVYRIRKPLDSNEVIFPDGTKKTVKPEQDPREVLADWLTSPENQQFNRNIANRIWYWLFGFGLVDEPDDFRKENPPVHPQVLDYLADKLVKEKYNLKKLYSIILDSAAYQQSSIPKAKQAEDKEYFASYPIRRIEAEVLQDIFITIFDLPITYIYEVPEPFTYIRPRFKTVVLSDSGISNSFLEMFGRASRDTGFESDRNNGITESQELFLVNSTEVNNWVARYVQMDPAFAERKKIPAKRGISEEQREEIKKFVNDAWLTFLSRYPSQEESKAILEELTDLDKPGIQRVQDIIWALLNTKEFLCRH